MNGSAGDSAKPRRAIDRLGVPPSLMRLGMRQLGSRVLNPSLSWQAQRQRLDKVAGASLVPKGTTLTERLINGVRADVLSSGEASPKRTVVHFHGGGYCVGSARLAHGWAARLSAQTGCRVVMPDYRLAPEHAHPQALEDAGEVVAALSSETAPGSIVVSGDSAGGGLALALVFAMRDAGKELPAGCMLLSPWLDLGADRRADPELMRKDIVLSPDWLEACGTAYANPSKWSDPSVSPLLGTHDRLPPLLIQAGSDDLIAPDAQRLAASASAAGVDVTYTRWPRMWHGFQLQAGMLAAANSAVSQAAWFIDKVMPVQP